MSVLSRKEVFSLGTAKGRRALGCFVAEGTRCVLECLPLFRRRELFATTAWMAEYPEVEATPVAQSDIARMSQQKSPQPVLAVFEIPKPTAFVYRDRLTLALDAVQDPGNLGTIIRLADWFGVTDILAGPGCADPFAPKVVQATMGALGRVNIHRVESLARTLGGTNAPVLGTFLDGADLYATELPLSPAPIVVMGNEGNGISPEVAAQCSLRVRIPSFPPNRPTVESLNVATATAITLSELTRRLRKFADLPKFGGSKFADLPKFCS